MAIHASVVWEVRSGATAANANGGGFRPGASGVDYSQQAAAQYNLTGCTSAAANAIILNANAAADMVGNIAHVISGTNATPGWYEIISVVVGTSITVDANWGTGAVANGVVNIGGALSLGSATANQTDTNWASAVIAGNTVYIKGTPSLGATCTITNGTSTAPVQVLGYNATRGDNPTGSSRPTLNCAGFTFNPGSNNTTRNIIFTGTNTNVVTVSSNSQTRNCKFINSSTTATRVALNCGSANNTVHDCEAISYRGTGISVANISQILGCYVHDSSIGINISSSGSVFISKCIIESCVAQAINNSAGTTAVSHIEGNTLYGCENKLGVGVAINASTTQMRVMNNIIYGFATGISDGAGAGVNYGDYNCLFNNTTNYSTFTAGANDITTTPSLSGVSQLVVTTATTANSPNTLTKTGANFITNGVTAGRDFVNITSTGGTAGIYGISSVDSETQLTLDLAPGASAGNVSAQITTGRNFAPASNNIKQVAFPRGFPAGLTTSYADLGGVQRNGNIDQPNAADVRSGTTYNNGSSTGTLLSGGASGLGPIRIG